MIVVLNGPSVSGKTSIQKALQARLVEPHLAMGLDSIFCGMLPQRYFTSEQADRKEVVWADATTDAGGAPLFELHLGPIGRRVFSGMHHAIAAFAGRGCGVLVDYIAYEPALLLELADVLRPFPAYLIGVRIPLEVLEAREKLRGTSPVGHTRSHYETVHAHAVYDLEVDTSRASPDACAEAILQHVQANPEPTAFRRLRERAG